MFGIYSDMGSFHLTPRKEISTPVHEMQVVRHTFLLNNVTPINEQNNFDITPKHPILISTPMHPLTPKQ